MGTGLDGDGDGVGTGAGAGFGGDGELEGMHWEYHSLLTVHVLPCTQHVVPVH